MTFSIGRCSIPKGPTAVDHSGNQVTLSFHLEPTRRLDSGQLQAMRQQLLGLVGDEDELVIPVVWSADAALDGFYRPVAVSVPPADMGVIAWEIHGCSITLDRLVGYANPWFEVVTQSIVRSNVHSVTVPEGVVAAFLTPSALGESQYDLGNGTIRGATVSTRTVDSGESLTVWHESPPIPLTAFRFSVAPSKFYTGSCRLEIRRGGVFYPAVGRDIDVTPSTVWRISNGLVRLTSADGATPGKFEMWDNTAGAWESQSIKHAIVPSSGINAGVVVPGGKIGQTATGSAAPLTVLRNSPEDVIVRVEGIESWVTWRIQRGSFNVEFSHRTYPSDYSDAGVMYDSTTAMTSFTGGLWRTTADGSGNGLTFSTPQTGVKNATAGGLAAASIAIGANLGATNATVAAVRRDEFFGAAAWRQRVIVR
jgi:hypothetical protein